MFLAQEDVVMTTFNASKSLEEVVVCRQHMNRFKEKVATRGMLINLQVVFNCL